MKKYLFYSKPLFCLLLFIKLLASSAMVGLALVLQYVTNLLIGGETQPVDLFIALGYSLLYVAVSGGLFFANAAAETKYANEAVNRLRNSFSEKLLQLNYEKFASVDTAQYISNLTNDMKLLATNYFSSQLSIPDEIFTFLLAVGVAFYIHPVVAATMLGLVLLVLLVPIIFNKPMNKANVAYSNEMNNFTQMIKQTFLGIDVIKNFGNERLYMEKIAEHNKRLTKKNTLIDRLTSFSMVSGILIVVLMQLGTMAISGYYVLTGVLTIGSVIAVVQLGNQLFSPITNVANKATLIQGVKELSQLLDKTLSADTPRGESFDAFCSDIILNDVSFTYPDATAKSLENVSLRFEKDKKYLIVGQSGSGKSTILKLLTKMYCGYEGNIQFDGNELSKISAESVNGFIASTKQNGYVFSTTIRDNIDFLDTKNYDMINTSVELAHLSDFIARFSDGLDAQIDEEVNQISGGEKTRLGLARAICKNSDILLLDEVTSALDKDTSHIVEKNVLSLKNKTVINVSHKIHEDLLPGYDKIAIMEKGKLLEFGNVKDIQASRTFSKYIKDTRKQEIASN